MLPWPHDSIPRVFFFGGGGFCLQGGSLCVHVHVCVFLAACQARC